MLIAQLTDFHVGRVIQTEQGPIDLHDRMLDAVAHIKNMNPQPDLLMVTGDLSNHGNEADYIRVRTALQQLEMPIYVIPGNHDRRSLLRKLFSDHDYWPQSGFIQYVLEQYPLRIICLDTLADGQHYGMLCKERLAWLTARLDEDRERPSLIFMHHPPFTTGLCYPDQLMCRNGDAFGDIIARHSQIQAIICGHVHRDVVTFWRGVSAYVTASATFSNGLILYPVDDVDPLFEPPMCRLFQWQNGRLTSHISFIGSYMYGLSEGVPKPPDDSQID